MPPSLPSILPRSDRRHSGTGDTAQLWPKMSVSPLCVERWGEDHPYGDDDHPGNEGFEGYTHVALEDVTQLILRLISIFCTGFEPALAVKRCFDCRSTAD